MACLSDQGSVPMLSLGPMMVPAIVRYWVTLKEFRKVLPMVSLSDQGLVIEMESMTDPKNDSRLATSTV